MGAPDLTRDGVQEPRAQARAALIRKTHHLLTGRIRRALAWRLLVVAAVLAVALGVSAYLKESRELGDAILDLGRDRGNAVGERYFAQPDPELTA